MKNTPHRMAGLFFFLLLLPSILAYDFSGDDDNYAGNIVFDDTTVGTTSIETVSAIFLPLTGDLNNDNNESLILLAGTIIRLYDAELNFMSSHQIDNVTDLAPLILVDDDADGDKEIYVLAHDHTSDCGDEVCIFRIDYENTNWTQTTLATADIVTGGTESSVVAIGCQDTIIPVTCVYTTYEIGFPTNANLRVYGFNGSNINDTLPIDDLKEWDDTAGSKQMPCPNSAPNIIAKDWDNDGTIEYLFTYFIFGEGGNEAYNWASWTINDNGRAVQEDTSSTSLGDSVPGSNVGCEDSSVRAYQKMSNAYVADIDGVVGNGDELVLAVMTDSDEFKMFSFHSDGSVMDDYPETILEEAEGDWVGPNIFVADVFGESGRVDFCINTITQSDHEENILCASEQVTEILGVGNYEYFTTDFNTINFAEAGVNTPYTNAFAATRGGVDKLVTTHGVFTFTDTTGLPNFGDGVLTLDFQLPKPVRNSSLIMADLEPSGFADIYVLTATNAWLFDDDQVNRGCGSVPCMNRVGETLTIDPSIEAVWRINTSVEIRISATDVDGDNVSVRAFLYYNDGNEMLINWSNFAISGTTFSFFYDSANKTINNGVIRLEARDEVNQDSVESLERLFTVGTEGITKGEQVFTEGLGVNVSEINITTLPEGTSSNNPFTVVMDLFQLHTRLSTTIVWLFLMAIIGYGVWKIGAEGRVSSTHTLGLMLVIELFMIIAGTIFNYLSIGVLITIIIIAVAVVVFMFLRPIITGGG